MEVISMFLFYFVIFLFCLYTFKNTKPIKLNDVLNAFTFGRQNDDIVNIPGPVRLPFFGTKWNSWFVNMSKLHEYYANLNVHYGDVVMEMMGNVPVISLFKRQDIEKVLRYPSKYPFRPPTEIVSFYRSSRPDRYSSIGLINAQGPEWAHLRMKLTPKTFESRLVLARFCPDLNEICDDFIRQVKERRNDENIAENVDDLLKSMSFETSCCLITGKRMGFLNGNRLGNENFVELADSLKLMFQSFRDAYYGSGMWRYFPSKVYKNYVKSEEKAYEIVSDIINKTKQDEQNQNNCDKESILTTILNTVGLEDNDKISGVIDFLTAGIEPVSHTVSFLLYYLSTNPEAQEQIYQETVNMCEELTQEDLSRAFYTRAAIHEAFRLSPTAFAVARILEKDFYLSGYHLKAGSVVLCQNMIACSKNENFENANEYKPERWLKENGEFNANQCLGSSITLPFGCGKRICPGKKYTEMEMTILVIKLVRSFKIKYSSEFDHQFEFLLAPKTPVNIQFCDR